MVRVKSSSAYKSQDVSDFKIDRDISFSFLYHTQWCSWLRSNSLMSGNLASHPCWDRKRKRAEEPQIAWEVLKGSSALQDRTCLRRIEQVHRLQDPCSRHLVSAGLRQHWGIQQSPRRRYPAGHGSCGSSNLCVLLLWTFHWLALNDRATHPTESIGKIQAKCMLRKEEMVDKCLPSLPHALFLNTDLSRQPRSRKIKREIYKLLFPLVNLLCSVRFATQGISQLRKDQKFYFETLSLYQKKREEKKRTVIKGNWRLKNTQKLSYTGCTVLAKGVALFQDTAKPVLADGKANGSLTFDAVLVL